MAAASKNFIISLVFSLMLGGCSTQPPRVDANIPLVHSTMAFSLNNNEAKNIPEDLGTIKIEGSNYSTVQQYTSATGRPCRVLDTSESHRNSANQARACLFDGQWQFLTPLIKSSASQYKD